MSRRKILVLTGIRSEYGILFPVLRAIQEHPQLELLVVAAAAHCSPALGHTVEMIEQDGFPIAERIESLLSSNTPGGRIKSTAIEMLGLVQTLERLRPDLIVAVGDREEPLVAAFCGVHLNIPMAHLCGGDYVIGGNADDSIRHAVSKMAHLHFPMSEMSAERLRRMGEEDWRIHCTGNPGLDRLFWEPPLTREELASRWGFALGQSPLVVIIQHPVNAEAGDAARQMAITLEAVADVRCTAILIYPNSDPGSHDTIRTIESYLPKTGHLHAFRNLPQSEFVNLLRHAGVLVGNSSLGILEAPALRLPVVNIGNRQNGREHAANVQFVPHEKAAIQHATERALFNAGYREEVAQCHNPLRRWPCGEAHC